MGLNLEKIKAALQSYENPASGGTTGNDKLLRLDPGDDQVTVVVKIVPYKFNLEDPFLDMWFHYGLPGMRTALCPRKMENTDCSVCEFGYKVLNKYKETKNPDDRKPLDVLLPKRRIYAPVVIMSGEEEKVVKLWGFGETVHQELLRYAFEFGNEGVDITDPKNSPEFKITVQSPKRTGKKFNTTTIAEVKEGLKIKTSALASTAKEITKILDTCPNISEIYSPKTSEQMKEALDKYVRGETTSSTDSQSDMGTEKNFEKKESTDEGAASTEETLEDISKKFRAMANKGK